MIDIDSIVDKVVGIFDVKFNRELEREFRAAENIHLNRHLRFILTSLAVCVGLQYLVFPDFLLMDVLIKAFLPVCLFGILATFVPGDYRHGQIMTTMASCVVGVVLTISVIHYSKLRNYEPDFTYLSLVIVTHYVGLQALFTPTIVTGIVMFFANLFIVYNSELPYGSLDHYIYISMICHFLGAFVSRNLDLMKREEFLAARRINEEKASSVRLKQRILPKRALEHLDNEGNLGKHEMYSSSDQCCAMYVVIRGADRHSLKSIFEIFDYIIARSSLEKIKTNDNAYLVAGGMFVPNQESEMVSCALRFQQEVWQWNHDQENQIQLSIGIGGGPLSHGIVGTKTYAFDVWGSAVNISARLALSNTSEQITTDSVSSL